MAREKRADIVASKSHLKVPIELKRDNHAEVWTAAEAQLDRFYTIDPAASSFGIYAVFWFGAKRGRGIPVSPHDRTQPTSSCEMEQRLRASIPIKTASARGDCYRCFRRATIIGSN